MPSQLQPYLDRIGEEFAQNWYHIRDVQDWMLEEIFRKRKTYPYWRKKVLFTFVSWKKKQNSRHPDNQTFNMTHFYYHKFDWLFQYYIKKLFSPFEARQLTYLGAIGSVHKLDEELLHEYKYFLSPEEYEIYDKFRIAYQIPDTTERIITYIVNIAILVFNKIIQEIIKSDFIINMIGAVVKTEDNGQKYVHFLISNRDSDLKFYHKYLYSLIYQFAEILPQIDNKLLLQLRMRYRQIFPLAIQEYQHSKQNLTSVLFLLQHKVQVLHHITPILDVMNFICARIEDSIYDTLTLVENIVRKTNLFPNSPHMVPKFIELFKFINNAASLFSTFQSNNRANPTNQYLLFFFYVQHFCAGGIKGMEQNNSFFFPSKLQKEHHPNFPYWDHELEPQYFQNFIFHGMQLPYTADSALDSLFQNVFLKPVQKLNEEFFESFLFSLNQKFLELLKDLTDLGAPQEYDFNKIVHYLFILLYNLVDYVFIESTPKEAQKHFKDRLSRYTPEKIALRVLELKIFKIIPLSDNNWQDYFLSRNKTLVYKLFKDYYNIPESYFFSDERLLKINMMYERGLSKQTPYLEEWLIDSIFHPFFNFQNHISTEIMSKSTFVSTKEDANQIIFNWISRGVIDRNVRARLEELADFLTQIWITE